MDDTTTGSSITTTTRSSTRTRATPIPARSGAIFNTTSRLETRPVRSSTDLGSTEMGTSGATSRSAPPDSLEVSWAIPSCLPGSSPRSSRSWRSRSGRAADHGSLRNHRPSDIGPAQSTEPRSLLIASPYATPVTKLSDIGERGAIDILARIYDRGQPIGLGHDCGVVDWGDDYLVVTTDVVNRKTHIPTGATAQQIGWYATAVNLSDIAAAGARPLGFVAALSMPADTDVEFLRGLANGMEECVREFGIAVLGGDTKEADILAIAGTAFGRVRKERILLRTGARPGDAIVVTGDLGRAGHAAKTLEQSSGLRTEALNQLLRPYPRIADGMFFSESGAVTSCMDLSDGLGASLGQLAAMTKLSYQIDEAALPRYLGLTSLPPAVAKELVLYYGGDYELIATVRPDAIQTVLQRYSESSLRDRRRLTMIGKVAASGGNALVTKTGKEPLLAKGWEHFRSSGIR